MSRTAGAGGGSAGSSETNGGPAAGRRSGRESEDRVLEALDALGGSSSLADLRIVTELPERTQRDVVRRLHQSGHVVRSHGRASLTAAGRQRLEPPLDLGRDAFDIASESLLPPWQAALARLMADAITFRRLNPRARLQPGFVVFGPVNTAKTSTVLFVIQSLGIADASSIVNLDALAPGELLGRRVGGRFERSPLVDHQLLALDEFVAADVEVRRKALNLWADDPLPIIEGEAVPVRCVPAILFNPPPGGGPIPKVVPDRVLRRSFVLDTAPSVRSVRAAQEQLDEFHSASPRQLVDLDAIDSGPQELVPAIRRLLASPSVGNPLTEEGGRFWEKRKVEICAMGRAARWGLGPEDDLTGAALGVLLDGLTCLETVGNWVDPDWRHQLNVGALTAPGAERFLQQRERGLIMRREVSDQLRARKIADEQEELAIAGRRAALVSTWREARRSIERIPEALLALRPRAAGVRAQLKKLEEKASDARTGRRLDELAAAGLPVLDGARSIAQAVVQERHAREEQKRLEAEVRESARGAARDAKRQADAIVKTLGGAKSELAALKRHKGSVAEGEVVRRLFEIGALVGSQVTVQQVRKARQSARRPARSSAMEIARRLAPPELVSVHVEWCQDALGRWHRRADLSSWQGDLVQQLLAEAIQNLDRHIELVRAGAVGASGAALAALPRAALPPGRTP